MATFRRLTLAFMLFLICLPILSSIVEGNIVIYDSQGTAITYAHEPYIINPTNTTYQDHNIMLNVKFYANLGKHKLYNGLQFRRSSQSNIPFIC